MKLSGVSIISKKWRNFKSNLVFVVVLVLESKGLHCLLWGHLRSLLHPKKVTMILFTHNLPLLSLRWKVLHFLLSIINKLDLYFLQWQFFSFVCALRNHVTRSYPLSQIKCVQRLRVSWIGPNNKSTTIFHGLGHRNDVIKSSAREDSLIYCKTRYGYIVQFYFERAHYLFSYLIDVYI